ncbi:hypothetical protein [Salinicoccus sp. CNSTN-B1]
MAGPRGDYFKDSNLIDREIILKPETIAEQNAYIKELVLGYRRDGRLKGRPTEDVWHDLSNVAAESVSIEMQELLHTLLLELYTDHVVDLERCMNVDETYQIEPRMTVGHLQSLIDEQYHWVFQYDFDDPDEKYYFWYRSKEKRSRGLG